MDRLPDGQHRIVAGHGGARCRTFENTDVFMADFEAEAQARAIRPAQAVQAATTEHVLLRGGLMTTAEQLALLTDAELERMKFRSWDLRAARAWQEAREWQGVAGARLQSRKMTARRRLDEELFVNACIG